MTLQDIFLVDGDLRPIWRFFLSLVVGFFAYSLAYLLARGVRGLSPRLEVWYGSLMLFELLALLGTFKLMTALFERKPLAVVGLAFYPSWMKELCLGMCVGGVMIVSVGGGEALLGLARFTPSAFGVKAELGYGSALFLVLLLSATNEELIFRGYPFQKLVESLGPIAAVAASSAFFGLAHLGNPHHTLVSTVNTMLVGIPLSIAYLRTRALWMPIGIHLTWNYLQGFVFGLPVSGLTFSPSLLKVQVQGATWMTGAAYGPEGGLLCTFVEVGAGIFLFSSARIRISERMKELVFGPSPAAAASPVVCVPPGPDPGEESST